MSKKKKTIDKLLEEAMILKEEEPYEIPENWVYFKFTSILDIQGGTQPPKTQFVDEEKAGYVRLVQIRDFSSDKYRTYIPDTEKLKKIEDEDILIARYGASIGRILTGLSGAYNVALAKVIFPRQIIDREYLYWLLKSEHFQRPLMSISRSAQSGFNKNDLSYFIMPLPPFNEQKRIAEKVERLLSKIDEAEQLIDEAKKTFELRRAAILDKAFTGELTKTWRGSMGVNNDNYLENIFNQKRSLYEKLLKEAQQKGLKKPSKLKFYGEPDKIDSLAVIPDSWNYTYLGNVIYDFKYGTSEKSSYENEGNPVIRIPNIGEEYINIVDMKYLAVNDKKIEDKVEVGDLLIIRSNGSRNLVGKCAIVDERVNGYAYASYLIRMRAIGVYPKFIYWLMKSDIVKRQLFSNSKSSAGINNINTQELASIVIPIPSKKEQMEIVNVIESLIYKESEVYDSLTLALELDSLKQSILSKGFKGELGTNDSNDEPAVELLKSVLQ